MKNLVLGKICKDKKVLICFYQVEIYFNYFHKHKNEIKQVIIGNGEHDIPYFTNYHNFFKRENNKLHALSIKPADYDINTQLNAIIINKDSSIVNISIPIENSVCLKLEKPINNSKRYNIGFVFKLSTSFNNNPLIIY